MIFVAYEELELLNYPWNFGYFDTKMFRIEEGDLTILVSI